jgi:hypothetical protein
MIMYKIIKCMYVNLMYKFITMENIIISMYIYCISTTNLQHYNVQYIIMYMFSCLYVCMTYIVHILYLIFNM